MRRNHLVIEGALATYDGQQAEDPAAICCNPAGVNGSTMRRSIEMKRHLIS